MVIDRMLRRISLSILLILAMCCIVVSLFHTSENPWILGWSKMYLLGVVGPVLGCFCFQSLLVLAPRFSRSVEPAIAFLAGISSLLIVVLGVGYLPHYELNVMAIFLGIQGVILIGFRVSRSRNWLLSYSAVGLLALLIFIPEILGHTIQGRRDGMYRGARWRDAFLFTFPSDEPFVGPGGFMKPNLNLTVYPDIPGRRPYLIQTNSQGYRNSSEVPLKPELNEFRVLNLGDSFSNGFAMNQEEFLGPLLEARWRDRVPGRKVTVLNAEVSDPAYGLLFLQRYGIRYSPQVVLYGLVDNDLHQTYWAYSARRVFSLDSNGAVVTHPLDRSESDRRRLSAGALFSQVVYPEANAQLSTSIGRFSSHSSFWWSKIRRDFLEFRLVQLLSDSVLPLSVRDGSKGELAIYDMPDKHSFGHLRLFGGSNLGMLYKKNLPLQEALYSALLPVFEAFDRICKENGTTFVLVYFPRRVQAQPQDWQAQCEFWRLQPGDFDLDQEADRLRSFCRERGILFCDLTSSFRAAAQGENLFLWNDSHPNEYGQIVAAEEVGRFVEEALSGRP